LSWLLSRGSRILLGLAFILFSALVPGPLQAEQRDAAEEELQELARGLRVKNSSSAYAWLSGFAVRHAADPLGARAALALGYSDYTRERYSPATRWLEKAEGDPLLREYALYWGAQARLGGQRGTAEALAKLETFRREFPESVMTELAVQALAKAALALGNAEQALEELEAYKKNGSNPPLLLLRAEALEHTGQRAAAAKQFETLYVRFPLSDEAKQAGRRLGALARILGREFPAIPVSEQFLRASLLYEAGERRMARAEYLKLLPKLTGADRERAALRIAQCRAQLGAGPSVLASLVLRDADLDAERLYTLALLYRARMKEAAMLGAVEELASRYRESRWNEDALFGAANYFWANLDRQRAIEFYRRLLERFPGSRNGVIAHWRLVWQAYRERGAEAAGLLEEHLRRFHGSPFTADALYWLGRAAERSGDLSHAPSFYLKLLERFPQSYFSRQAAERLRALGEAPTNASAALALIPSPPALPLLEETIPLEARARFERAAALRRIGFDASAELELQAAYAGTGSPVLLVEAARALLAAGRYFAGISTARQVVGQIEARRLEDLPEAIWRTVYPFPFESEIVHSATRFQVDPMLVAGLVRQESAFQPDAVSSAGAVGLMQVLPQTGRKLARQVRVGYSRKNLRQPEYNLRLGSAYLAQLLKSLGSLEAALAAYNAGEDRVAAWLGEQRYDEPAEFVESIPFTETREYVQVVIRNAEMYRRLYGGKF
jgi:soluble lytic murein transglycosylase